MADEPIPCSPCRGTGKVLSNQGGEPHEVPCPWCGGTGRKPAPPPAADDG